MNPRTPTGGDLESERLEFKIEYSPLRNDFKKWLSKYSKDYIKTVLSYLDRYLTNRVIRNQKDVLELMNSVEVGKRQLCYSLRVFFNFLEELDIIDKEILNKLRKVVKIPRTGSDNYIPSDEEILEAYRKIKNEETRIIFKLLAFSGIRISEASKLLSEFDKSKLMINGNIAKYPLSMLRGTKNVYYAYMPKNFALELRKIKITKHAIENRLHRLGLPAKYLRKWNYNFLILNGVPESVADFIQGRASITVGSMHYLAKVRQADEWYSRIVDKLLEIFG